MITVHQTQAVNEEWWVRAIVLTDGSLQVIISELMPLRVKWHFYKLRYVSKNSLALELVHINHSAHMVCNS